MAFLNQPTLSLGSPVSVGNAPGVVGVTFSVGLVVERLERCFAKICDDAASDRIYEITAEIWSKDDNSEPVGTLPIRNAPVVFWRWGTNHVNDPAAKRVLASDLENASPIVGSPSKFQLTFNETGRVAERSLNEDFLLKPPPGKPATALSRDELFLRVYLSTVFSGWQVIQTIDSQVVTGQFFGP